MKYFEVYDPYYALIKADNKEKVIEGYTAIVADDNGTLTDEIKEVSRDYALAKFSRGLSETGEEIEISEILTDFQKDEGSILLIDGNLL